MTSNDIVDEIFSALATPAVRACSDSHTSTRVHRRSHTWDSLLPGSLFLVHLSFAFDFQRIIVCFSLARFPLALVHLLQPCAAPFNLRSCVAKCSVKRNLNVALCDANVAICISHEHFIDEIEEIGSVGDKIGMRNWPVALECSVANCLSLPRNSLESGKTIMSLSYLSCGGH